MSLYALAYVLIPLALAAAVAALLRHAVAGLALLGAS